MPHKLYFGLEASEKYDEVQYVDVPPCATQISPGPIVGTGEFAVIEGRWLRAKRNEINRKFGILGRCVADPGKLLTIQRQLELNEPLDDGLADLASDVMCRVGGADKLDNGVQFSREKRPVIVLDLIDAMRDRKILQRLDAIPVGQDAHFGVQFLRSVFEAIVQSVHIVDQAIDDA